MKFSLENLPTFQELIRQLSAGLDKLDFIDNFEAFETTVTIPASSESQIRNQLKFIPTRYMITRQTGNGLVTDSGTTWTNDYLYMQNHGSNSVTVKIIFMR